MSKPETSTASIQPGRMLEVGTFTAAASTPSEGLTFRREGRVIVVTTCGAGVPRSVQITFDSNEEARICKAAQLTERLKDR